MGSLLVDGPARDAVLVQGLCEAVADKAVVIFDYDGTLAWLDVDWEAVRRDLSAAAATCGFGSEFRPLWDEMTRFRDCKGEHALTSLFAVLERHERRGVEKQRPRESIAAVARELSGTKTLGVCSSNLRGTVMAGLERLGLREIQAIAAADDVRHWKPEPEGLMSILRDVGAGPNDAIFIGDTGRDALAAQRAGIAFYEV